MRIDPGPAGRSGRRDGGLTAFVLGGGGLLGAHEVGMLQALDAAGVLPDLIVGTSVGALNGVFVASGADAAVERLAEVWRSGVVSATFRGSFAGRLATLARSGTHVHTGDALAALVERHLPVRRFEDLAIPFQCVAASVERATAHWFDRGPVIPAVLASCAVPGLLPPVEIGGEHFYDGGLVHSIPVGRAVELGARTVYVLHVGRIERPLAVPRWPWEVGLTAFEIARRHRFVEEMATLPEEVTVHVLPSGAAAGSPAVDLGQLRHRGASRIQAYIDRARAASGAFLADVLPRRR